MVIAMVVVLEVLGVATLPPIVHQARDTARAYFRLSFVERGVRAKMCRWSLLHQLSAII